MQGCALSRADRRDVEASLTTATALSPAPRNQWHLPKGRRVRFLPRRRRRPAPGPHGRESRLRVTCKVATCRSGVVPVRSCGERDTECVQCGGQRETDRERKEGGGRGGGTGRGIRSGTHQDDSYTIPSCMRIPDDKIQRHHPTPKQTLFLCRKQYCTQYLSLHHSRPRGLRALSLTHAQ